MPRPNQTDQQRQALLPVVCQVFAELGYRRATTAELATRCGVRENILYRLWPDKKAMFLAALEDISQRRARTWGEIIADQPDWDQTVERLVAYEAKHQGEFGFYRVVFTALGEMDDADIRSALTRMYRGFHQLVLRQIGVARNRKTRRTGLGTDDAAWGLLGLATIANITRELKMLRPRERERMFAAVAGVLVGRDAA